MSDFGSLLKKHREDRRLSQAKLAARAQFDTSYLSRLESGQRMPTRDAVERLADALELSRIEADTLFQAAHFSWESAVSPGMLSEARQHVAKALALLGGVGNAG